MKRESYDKPPSIQWVRPAAAQSILLRPNGAPDEKATNQPKPFVMFDEIFPAKKNIDSIEKGKEYKEMDDTFHRAIGPVLTIGQCFGILPISGIRKPDASFLKFAWFSWKVGFTLISMFGSAIMGIFCLLKIIYTGVDIYKTISFVFYGSTFLVLVLFLRLAPHWAALGVAISHRERTHISRIHPKRRSLRSKFSLCCFAILFPALVEHVLAIFAGVVVAYDCTHGLSFEVSYFVSSYAHIFYFTEYSLWKGVLLQLINLESTFNWNFMDLFIIVVSIGLADRFNQLNDRLEAVRGKHLPEHFWKSAREEFAHLSRLVKKVDASINEIVLLSFANNLYFICLQLFNSLKLLSTCHSSRQVVLHIALLLLRVFAREGSVCRPLRGLSHAVYFTFSFGFLVTRSLAVSLSAAGIHSSSRQPAATLYAAPSSSYGTELQRFLEQVVTDMVAITGLNFFYVTRGLVLTIAGTIVTYELVLVQFNTSPPPVTANITINDSCGIPIKA